MEAENLPTTSNPEQLLHYARDNFLAEMRQASGHGGHTSSSLREGVYKGRKIRIETTYRITIDDEPVLGEVMVDNSGRVHYHSIPNQDFESAMDMVKRVIDLVPPSYSPHSSHGR